MSVFSSIISGLASLQKGKAEQAEFKTKAAAELFEAGNERINSLRAENQLTDALNRTLAGQNVAFAAAGIDPSSPLAKRAQAEAVKVGEQDAAGVRLEGILRSQRRRARARSLKRAGRAARKAGIVSAIGSFSDAAASAVSGAGSFGG